MNEALIACGCKPRRFVSNVIERVQDEEIGANLKARMLGALEAALRPFMGEDASLDVLMGEWMSGVVWMDIRTACVHPLQCSLKEGGGLAELRQVTSTQPGYSSPHC